MNASRSLRAAFKDDIRRQRVLAALKRGRDGARSHSDIAEELGSLSRRQVEIAVNELRRDGWNIAGGSEGQWLTESADELDRTADWLESKIVAQVATVRALRATAALKRAAEIHQDSLWPAA